MGHPLQISRRTEYGLRAMVYLASKPVSAVVPFREIAVRMDVPQDFLAKILKKLVKERLAVSSRGAHGGYSLGRPPAEISMLEVIEAVEGPVQVNLCIDGSTGVDAHDACAFTGACTMYGVWRLGQQRMLEVYKHATLDKLAMAGLQAEADAERSTPALDLRRAVL